MAKPRIKSGRVWPEKRRSSGNTAMYEEYGRNTSGGLLPNTSVDFKDNFFRSMLQEARTNPRMLSVQYFLRKMSMHRKTMLEWVNTYPSCKEIYNEVLAEIGDKREMGALIIYSNDKTAPLPVYRLSEQIYKYTAAFYQEDVKDLLKWVNDITKDRDRTDAIIQILQTSVSPETCKPIVDWLQKKSHEST